MIKISWKDECAMFNEAINTLIGFGYEDCPSTYVKAMELVHEFEDVKGIEVADLTTEDIVEMITKAFGKPDIKLAEILKGL